MEVSLAERVAIITGGSKGLGLAMAKRFRGAGGSVCILARRQQELEQAKREIEAVTPSHPGSRVMALSADVSQAYLHSRIIFLLFLKRETCPPFGPAPLAPALRA